MPTITLSAYQKQYRFIVLCLIALLIHDAAGHDWPLHGREYNDQRFSPLTQINEKNVNQLGLAWSYEMKTHRGLQATPIMVNGVLYVTGTWGKVAAIDAQSGERLWEFDPEVPGKWGRYGCCDAVNRGVAYWDGYVYVASFDGRLIALNAETGAVIWEVDTIDSTAPYTSTGAPRIVKDKILIGNAGADYGVRGYISAYHAKSGKLEWRFFTVPGNPQKPFEHPELEIAAKTWKGSKWWQMGGGGTVWDSMTYDAELDLLYFGVGNGSPWPQAIRSPEGGDNLFLSSIVAVDPDSGEMSWFYQTTPGESLDFTATQNMILADLTVGGKRRKVLMQAPKNGFFYILDRSTGKVISAENYVTVNWASHIDALSGRPMGQKVYGADLEVTRPSPAGGHNWQPMAYNPITKLVYIPARESAGIFALSQDWIKKRDIPIRQNWWNIGVDWGKYTELTENASTDAPSKDFGFLGAWDPIKSSYRWTHRHTNLVNGGVLTTAGNLVMQGGGDGILRAHQAETGEVLWAQDLQIGMLAPPISYAIGNKQYIAILAGWGGAAIASGNSGVLKDGKLHNSGKLFVFHLGGKKNVPSQLKEAKKLSHPPEIDITADSVKAGASTYMEYCSLCHGPRAVSSGVIPDLRMISNSTHQRFQEIVLKGELEALGMPNFSDLLNSEDVISVHHYIIHRIREDLSK